MAAEFVTQAELESLIGVQKVLEYYDDDRDGALSVAEVDTLNETLSEANDIVIGVLLKKGWEADALETFISQDRAVRRSARQIAAGLVGERKPEFFSPTGEAPFATMYQRGFAYLRDLVKGEQRSTKEDEAGVNASIRGRSSISTPSTIFGRDPNDPNDLYGNGRGF